MKSIFDATVMGGLKMKNRLVRSATGENLATENGNIPPALHNTYLELAKGGAGMIILGFTSVAPIDHFRTGLMRLHDDALIAEYSNLAEAIHKYDCVAMPQLALAIYYKKASSGQWIERDINEMSKEDIQDVIGKFVSAAVRAVKAGFDGVQLHGAHGFLLSRFISPLYNHRTDEYGSDTRKRAQIILEIIRGIREKAGNTHISIKINNSDYMHGGLMPEESLTICKILEEAGMNSIEVSGNAPCVEGIRPKQGEGFFAPFAVALKSVVKIPIILTGGLRSTETMNKLLNEDGIEYFSLSRPLIREPDLPKRWKESNPKPSKCISCNQCFGMYGHKCVFEK